MKIGKPTVTVRIPEPQVTVDMPEPQIQVEQQDPEVNVVMAEPQITLAGQENEQSGTQPQQALVSVERDEQGPEIQLEQEEPEVKVEQAEATVEVTRSEQASDPAEASQQPNRMSIAGMPPDEIVGTNVVNSREEGIAEISELVKEKSGGRLFAILSVGGFLGIGDKEVAIPLDQFTVREDGTFVLSDRTEEEVESMTAYEPDNYQPIDQQRLLDPIDRKRFKGFDRARRMGEGPALIGVDHQRPVADQLANFGEALDILFDVGLANLDLECAVAIRKPAPDLVE